ncbi:TWiK family of potassium channels protein 18 [Anoplophora glabripennis]|uniref:TWiK family of potassium channels protein 18 n=1 Tax=Anoplophora glabripennis TaxID=217634 RepID=UPI000873AE12|nr:TWiK family of potassium channels protein 18 [Anoplophora glabripennis]
MERRRSVRRQRKYKRPWFKKCKEYVRQFIAFLFSNVGIIMLVVGYTIAGSFIFQAIESHHILEIKGQVWRNRTIYAQKLYNLSRKMNEEDMKREIFHKNVMIVLEEYQKIIVNFSRRGYDGTDDEDSSAQWSFAGAFLYSLTVITTIGYGNIFPRTPQGKITTIVYAIIGMPLFLLYLSNIGDIMARSFKWIYANCCLCRWCPGVAKRRAERRIRREQRLSLEYGSEESEQSSETWEVSIPVPQLQPRASIGSEGATSYTEDEEYDVQSVTVPLTICLLIMVGYICGGALLFCEWEEYWSFLDASYFCFISLSTIGFGDLVPGDKIYGRGVSFYKDVLELSFVFCSIYLMLGMALIAMCFNLMQEEVIHKIRSTIQTIKYILRCNR